MNRETGEILVRLLGKVIDGPAALTCMVAVATLTVVEYLVSCIDSGMASDIQVFKDLLLCKTKAARADAEKRLVEAVEAANRATLRKRNNAIARAELAQLKAAAAKTQAEADAIRSDAETRRLQAQAEAQAHLIEAIAKLRGEGGEVFLDCEALQRTIDAGPPPEEGAD